MAEEIKKVIVIDTKSSSRTIKSLKKDIDSLNSSLEELEIGSAEYNSTLELLSKKQRSFNEIQERINKSSFNTVQRWESIARLSSGLASGYGAATAAITLFGKESEDLDRIMVKLQSTIALVQGIGGLKDLVQELPLVGEAFRKVIDFINPFDKRLNDVAQNINNIDFSKLNQAKYAIDDISGAPTVAVSAGSGGYADPQYAKNVNSSNTAVAAAAVHQDDLIKKLQQQKLLVASSTKLNGEYSKTISELNGKIPGFRRALEGVEIAYKSGEISQEKYLADKKLLSFHLKNAESSVNKYNIAIDKNNATIKNARANITKLNKAIETSGTVLSKAKSIGKKALSVTLWTALATAVSIVIQKVFDYVSALKTAAKEQYEFRKSVWENTNQIAADTIVQFKQLQQAYLGVGDSAQAKQKFLKDYADQIEETGLKLNTVNDLDNAFVDRTNAYINAIMARAKAQAIENKAIELYEEFLNKRSELEDKIASGEAEKLTVWQQFLQGFLISAQERLVVPDTSIADKLASEQSAKNVEKVQNEITDITEETNEKLKGLFEEIAELEGQYVGFFNVKKVKKNGDEIKTVISELDEWLKKRAESKLSEEDKLKIEYTRLQDLAKDNDVALLEIEAWYQEELKKLRDKANTEALDNAKKAADDR